MSSLEKFSMTEDIDDFDPDNSFIFKKVVASVAHFTNPNKLVGEDVGFIPFEAQKVLRAKVESVTNGRALLTVRVPFSNNETDLTNGGVVHSSIFEPKVTGKPTRRQHILSRFISYLRPLACLFE